MPYTRKYTVNQEFFRTWSPSMAWVLGVICADGNLQQGKNCYGRLRIGMQDKDVLEKIREAMDSTHPITRRTCGKSWYWTLEIGSVAIFDDLVAIGVTPNKSTTITFPEMPKEYLSHFVRGYVDGNGCIYEYKGGTAANVASGSIEFLRAVFEICSSLGIKGYLRESPRYAHSISFFSQGASDFLQWIYQDHNGLCMERKLRKAGVSV